MPYPEGVLSLAADLSPAQEAGREADPGAGSL